MKFHWGTGIFIFLSLFIIALGVVLYKSRQVDNSLVLDKYYEEDINYQSKYEKMNNYTKLVRKINFIYTPGDDRIDLIFPYDPQKKYDGKVTLYRANAGDQDKVFDVTVTQDSILSIPLKGLASGKWTIKADWAWGGTPMYTEHKVVIQ
jgi:hypothetical protein